MMNGYFLPWSLVKRSRACKFSQDQIRSLLVWMQRARVTDQMAKFNQSHLETFHQEALLFFSFSDCWMKEGSSSHRKSSDAWPLASWLAMFCCIRCAGLSLKLFNSFFSSVLSLNEPAIYLDIYQHVSSFYRQHIFVPVLPKKLLEYVTYVHATFLRTRQSPRVGTVSELKQWQAAWAKRRSKRKPQAEFAPFESPWERPVSTQELCLLYIFLNQKSVD